MADAGRKPPEQKTLDFNKPYERRHGREPPAALRRAFLAEREIIETALGKAGRKPKMEIDLEGAGPETRRLPRGECLLVSANDFISVKSGNAAYRLVFTGMDAGRGLECRVFGGDALEKYRFHLREGDPSGQTLTNFTNSTDSSFSLILKRPPFTADVGKGWMALVEVTVRTRH